MSSNSSFKDRIKKSQRAFEYLILGKEKYLTLYTHEKFSRRSKKKPSAPKISTIIINWNRLHLLKKTVESYLSTISVPYELIIVDNASTDGSKEFIESVCNKDPNHIGIILTKNIGGEAINVGLELAGGSFLHVSENDIEYITGWDEEMLSKFDAFPKLGQLSPFSPQPQSDKGEIWEEHSSKLIKSDGQKIYLAETIGTSCIFPRQLWDKGIRWRTMPYSPDPNHKLPDDANFSRLVKIMGFLVAWNDKYTVFNWGHNVNEWIENPEYYIRTYQNKPGVGIKAMKERLMENGYDLIEENGKYRIIRKKNS